MVSWWKIEWNKKREKERFRRRRFCVSLFLYLILHSRLTMCVTPEFQHIHIIFIHERIMPTLFLPLCLVGCRDDGLYVQCILYIVHASIYPILFFCVCFGFFFLSFLFLFFHTFHNHHLCAQLWTNGLMYECRTYHCIIRYIHHYSF